MRERPDNGPQVLVPGRRVPVPGQQRATTADLHAPRVDQEDNGDGTVLAGGLCAESPTAVTSQCSTDLAGRSATLRGGRDS